MKPPSPPPVATRRLVSDVDVPPRQTPCLVARNLLASRVVLGYPRHVVTGASAEALGRGGRRALGGDIGRPPSSLDERLYFEFVLLVHQNGTMVLLRLNHNSTRPGSCIRIHEETT